MAVIPHSKGFVCCCWSGRLAVDGPHSRRRDAASPVLFFFLLVVGSWTAGSPASTPRASVQQDKIGHSCPEPRQKAPVRRRIMLHREPLAPQHNRQRQVSGPQSEQAAAQGTSGQWGAPKCLLLARLRLTLQVTHVGTGEALRYRLLLQKQLTEGL